MRLLGFDGKQGRDPRLQLVISFYRLIEEMI